MAVLVGLPNIPTGDPKKCIPNRRVVPCVGWSFFLAKLLLYWSDHCFPSIFGFEQWAGDQSCFHQKEKAEKRYKSWIETVKTDGKSRFLVILHQKIANLIATLCKLWGCF